MRKLLLSVAALGGLLAVASTGAQASPAAPSWHASQPHGMLTQVDYYWNHHHYHHRRWEHNRWRYYD